MAWTLHEGDCLEVLRTLPEGSVDAVICDPPYGTTRSKWDSAIPLREMWAMIRRASKHGAPAVLFSAQPFTSALVMSNAASFRHEWIWDKGNPSGHLNAKRRPLHRHENIAVFCDSAPPYRPQMREGRWRRKGSLRQASDCYGDQAGSVTFGGQYYPTSILPFSNARKKGKLHPNEKPADLLAYLVRTYTAPGETVLDFCAGSGTTGVACRREGRHSILIEREPAYCEIIRKRMAEEESKHPLFAEAT